MKEFFFVVEVDLEGGFTAKALGESIFTEADTLEQLRVNVKDAVECHFDADKMPELIRFHM
jgi:predicted RNase H-like HicB family nuclease